MTQNKKENFSRYVLSAAHCKNKTHARLGEWKVVNPNEPDFETCTFYNKRSKDLCLDENGKFSAPPVCFEPKSENCYKQCNRDFNSEMCKQCLRDPDIGKCYNNHGCDYNTYQNANVVKCWRNHTNCNEYKCKLGNAKIDCKDKKCGPELQVS